MGNLKLIALRHARDRWKDIAFIAAAVLLTAVAIGATTSKGVGAPNKNPWSVMVIDPDTNVEIGR